MSSEPSVHTRPTRGGTRAVGSAEVKRRPKDRKLQIAAAAAAAFGERGYHAVSVEDIAAAVGISGSALYRHFPNKYALFRHSAIGLTEALSGALDAVPITDDATQRDRLRDDLLAVIRITIANRHTAGIYRWEGRFLDDADRKLIWRQTNAVNERVRRHLTVSAQPLTDHDRSIVVVAMFSAIGSITVHGLHLSQREIERVLLEACLSIDRAGIGSVENPATVSVLPRWVTSNRRERLLQEAVRLFDENGYHGVSIDEIAAAAGLNASGMYRYFPSKADLLAALFYRAADRLDLATAAVLEGAASPDAALRAVTATYVDLSFAQHQLMSVYFSEMNNLLPAHRKDLKNRQKLYVVECARLLRDVRPELSVVESKFIVHAALNLVPDVGRLLGFESQSETAAKLQHLMLAVLLDDRS